MNVIEIDYQKIKGKYNKQISKMIGMLRKSKSPHRHYKAKDLKWSFEWFCDVSNIMNSETLLDTLEVHLCAKTEKWEMKERISSLPKEVEDDSQILSPHQSISSCSTGKRRGKKGSTKDSWSHISLDVPLPILKMKEGL